MFESSTVNEPSVFEPLRLYCVMIPNLITGPLCHLNVVYSLFGHHFIIFEWLHVSLTLLLSSMDNGVIQLLGKKLLV